MTKENHFAYQPTEHENEKASNSYLMSLVAVIAGLPLPIINLLATFFFYLANRKNTYFVRWHCTQALLSQMVLLFANSYSFWWTVSILFTDEKATNNYFAYLFTVIVFNVLEIISTIYCAMQTRKGKHVEVFFFGNLTNLICRS
jgi:uncharacterized Tic20 family protein